MNLNMLIAKIVERKLILRDLSFAYIRPTEDFDAISFLSEDELDRFANSIEENQEQIVLKIFNGKKSFFVSMNEYDAIIVDDGAKILVSSYWVKKETLNHENIEPNFKKAKVEVLDYFATAKMKKLAS